MRLSLWTISLIVELYIGLNVTYKDKMKLFGPIRWSSVIDLFQETKAQVQVHVTEICAFLECLSFRNESLDDSVQC